MDLKTSASPSESIAALTVGELHKLSTKLGVSMTDLAAGYEPWVDALTVAEFIDHAPKTVRKWANSGKLPAIKPGKKWLFLLSEVTAKLNPPPVEVDVFAQSSRSRARKRAT